MQLVLRGDLGVDTSCGISSHLPHLWQYLLLKIIFLIGQRRIQIPLKFLIRYLIIRLIPPIFGISLLHSIISKMYFFIKIPNIKLITRSPNISFCIPIRSHHTIHIRYHHIMTNIKFTIIVEKRSIYVHLNYISSSSRRMLFMKNTLAWGR